MKITDDIKINRLNRKFSGIEGQISRKEIVFLYNLAKRIQEGCTILEIGAFRGKSAIALGMGSKDGNKNKVYSIDPHDDFIGMAGGVFGPQDLKHKYKNIVKSGLGDLIFCISLSSGQVAKIWDKRIGLLWIDGDHQYESVKNDFEFFSTWVVSGGFVVFHDSEMEGVKKIIERIDKPNSGYSLAAKIESITVFLKK
jgi:predicted O-methyltransferase YrrM